MKYTFIFFIAFLSVLVSFAQKSTFDISTFTTPKGWIKEASESAVQFKKEDAAKGTYCLMTLYKAVPGTTNSKENFDLAWSSIVKEMVTVTIEPEMQSPANDKGWELQSGYAPFESEGSKGVVLLVTSTGFEKMVILIIITNTNVYEKEVDAFIASVSLKKPAGTTAKNNQAATKPVKPEETKPIAKQTDFAFTSTNFDDGWTSTLQEDWVQVTKGTIKVLIHYPNKKADAYNSVVLDGLKNAWNVLVAPRYSSASNFEFKPITGWQTIEFAEADMTEKTSGQTVYVVLFKMNYSNGSGKYLEFITADKNSFEKEFGAYHQTTSGWENMEKMANYNKFAVAAADLTGKWTNDFSGAIQYVNAATGFDAHMATHASVENFKIGPGSSYQWDLGVAGGNAGNIKFQSVKSSGKFSMNGNWQISFSDIEHKPRTYNAYFSCIKGLRILWLDDRAFAKVN